MNTSNTHELARLAVILTELKYTVWLESSGGVSNIEKIEKELDDYPLHNLSAESIVEYYTENNLYINYKDCDDLLHWLICNIRAVVEFKNYEIFSVYDSLSCCVSVDTDYRYGNAKREKAIGRYWTTIHKLRLKFGKSLESLRKKTGKKQDKFSLTKSQISLLENGKANVTLDNLLSIAREMNLELKFV
jgi:DNA-binding Xre family transcriptional regulator